MNGDGHKDIVTERANGGGRKSRGGNCYCSTPILFDLSINKNFQNRHYCNKQLLLRFALVLPVFPTLRYPDTIMESKHKIPANCLSWCHKAKPPC